MSVLPVMHYNRVGKTELRISAVGFGTCQLRLVPERQAIETLKRGFELGVNWVHTAPDYEGADDLIARAIAEFGHDVMTFSQGYGDMAHFEYLFESTCRKFHKTRLEMFGIACIEDREALGEQVWDAGGMIDFLLQQKQKGRLGGIFCTTHGAPDYVARLITSGYFDAVMLAYNPLGFHLLSYDPKGFKTFEDIPKTREQVFPLAVQHQVGLLIMKPLAGGLLCESKAFPPHQRFSNEAVKLTAPDILRDILRLPGVCAVVPGTASVEEAEENARAGHRPIEPPRDRSEVISHTVDEMRASLCSRCGLCDSLCSQSLPVSWLFRDAYISNYPSETFETLDQLQYFHLHPHHTAVCSTCTNITCHCPYDIDIPGQLSHIHRQMSSLRDRGFLPATPSQLQEDLIKGTFTVQVVSQCIPTRLRRAHTAVCRLYVHNAGETTWTPSSVVLAVVEAGKLRQQVRLRHAVEPGTRTHFTFVLTAFRMAGDYTLQCFLMSPTDGAMADDATEILTSTLSVADEPFMPFARLVPVARRLHKYYQRTKEFTLKQIRLLFTATS
jgi:predicted aldo/keto reductase-like oxidoreductase